MALATSRADFGGPDWLTIASGLVVFTVFPAAGYAAGVVAPLPLTPLAVGFGAVLLGLAHDYLDEALWSILPAWPAVESVSRTAASYYSWMRIAVFLAAAVACAAFAAAVLSGRRSWGMRPPPSASLALLPVAAAMAAVAAWGPTPLSTAPDTQPVCEAADHVPVCVHPAKRALLEPLVALAGDFFATVGSPPPQLAVVGDRVLNPQRGMARQQYAPDPENLWVSLQPEWPVDEHAPRDIASWLSGLGPCLDKLEDGRGNEEAFAVSLALEDWLLEQGGHPNPGRLSDDAAETSHRLGTAGRKRVAAWYRANTEAILDCEASLEGL